MSSRPLCVFRGQGAGAASPGWYLFPLLPAEVCSREHNHLQTPKVPASLPHGVGEHGRGPCSKQLLSYLTDTANGIAFLSEGRYSHYPWDLRTIYFFLHKVRMASSLDLLNRRIA